MLDPDAFTRAASQHPLTQANALAAARAVLVDGRSIIDTAIDFGVSKQRVSAVVARLSGPATPEGWVNATVCLPPELLAEVRAMEARAREALAP